MKTPNNFYGFENVKPLIGTVEQLVRTRAANYDAPVTEAQILRTIKQIETALQFVDGIAVPPSSNAPSMLFDIMGTYKGHNVSFTAGFAKLGISIERRRATITELKAL